MIVNSSGSLTCGDNRLLFTFLDKDNRTVGRPDRTASVALYNLGRDGARPVATADGTFVWGIQNERGFYVSSVTFPEAGEWGGEFTVSAAGGPPETIRMTFDVATSSPVVPVGSEAPASDTPTAASVGGDLAQLRLPAHRGWPIRQYPYNGSIYFINKQSFSHFDVQAISTSAFYSHP